MSGVCLNLRKIYAISSRPRILSLDHRPRAPSATYRRKGLEHGAIEVPTSRDVNDLFNPKPEYVPGKQLVVAVSKAPERIDRRDHPSARFRRRRITTRNHASEQLASLTRKAGPNQTRDNRGRGATDGKSIHTARMA